MTEPVKALSLWQPWASLIAIGAKRIETRSWATKHRGPLAIHAAARPLSPQIKAQYFGIHPGQRYTGLVHGPFGARICNRLYHAGYEAADGSDLPLGAVVAVCELVDCVPIVGYAADPTYDHITVTETGDQLHNWHYVEGSQPRAWAKRDPFDVSDQLPYGDFTPGRYAWILENVRAVSPPVEAKGRQQLWGWSPA